MQSLKVRHSVLLLAGMPRAGTAWYYSLLNELWITTGAVDARQLRTRYHLERYMSSGNALVSMKLPNLMFGLWPYLRGHTYVIKTHTSPAAYPRRKLSHWFLDSAIRWGWVIPLYIYREPRDVILSAYEFGQRGIKEGRPNAFSNQVQSIEMGIDWMQKQIINWRSWTSYAGVFVVRYEDLLSDYDQQVRRTLDYLHLDARSKQIQVILDKYRPGQTPQMGTHFYKGVAGRFREKFTQEQNRLILDRYGTDIQEMGYPL